MYCLQCGVNTVECGNSFRCPVCDETLSRDELADAFESMDGDFDSAMESAGMGTDEDYGDYGQYDDYFDQYD